MTEFERVIMLSQIDDLSKDLTLSQIDTFVTELMPTLGVPCSTAQKALWKRIVTSHVERSSVVKQFMYGMAVMRW